jgi:large subunit ribosomal protein L32
MPNPKQKHTHTRTHKRRAHHALSPHGLVKCTNCGNLTLPHHACDTCGFYKERDILKLSEKLSKKEQKKLKKMEKEKEAQKQAEELKKKTIQK